VAPFAHGGAVAVSIWIELHCDALRYDGSEYPTDTRCLTHRNANPGALSGNSKAAIAATLAYLQKQALATGWVRRKREWICPPCQR
jgi:hypothetical protein